MSDGSVVHWDQPTPASGVEPEHPAPSFTVTPAAAPSGHDSAAAAASTEATHVDSAGGDTLARTLGGIAVVLALGAAAIAVAGRRRQVTGTRP
jgi:hypothetical protein